MSHNFEVRVDRILDTPTVRLAGDLMLGDAAESLGSVIQRLIAEGRPHIICDVEGIAAVDSTGLTALIAAHEAAQRAGGAFVLLRPPTRLRTLLETTRLVSMFRIADDEPTAIQALGVVMPSPSPTTQRNGNS
jgi:anti-anti-sigma factor